MRRSIIGGLLLFVSGCTEPTGPEDIGEVNFTIISGNEQYGPSYTELPQSLVVLAEWHKGKRKRKGKGKPWKHQVVNFVVTAGGGSVFAGAALTDKKGMARDFWTLGDAGPQEVQVRAVDNKTGKKLVFATFVARAFDPVSITTTSLAGGVVGTDYSQTLTATGGDGNYTWSVSGGALPAGLSLNSSTELISGTPTTAGTTSFTLQVTDANGRVDTQPLSITVAEVPANVAPTAAFTVVTVDRFAGETVSFDATASSDSDGIVVDWIWDFGDGEFGSGVSPDHTFASEGTYTVSLTVTDDGGLTDTISALVSVQTDLPPTADFSFTAGQISINDIVDFDASASSDAIGISTYSFDFGDGSAVSTSASPNHTHQYSAAGSFDVTLTVTDGSGQTDAVTKAVTVLSQAPVADFSFTAGNLSIDDNVAFDGSGSTDDIGISTYSFNFGDGSAVSTSASPNHTHQYSAVGSFDVELTVTNGSALTASVTKVVTITDQPPVAAFTVSSAAPTTETVITFSGSASTDDFGVTGYLWDWGDGSSQETGLSNTHQYAAAGTYTVTLIVTDAAAQADTSTQSVLVDGAPTAWDGNRFPAKATIQANDMDVDFTDRAGWLRKVDGACSLSFAAVGNETPGSIGGDTGYTYLVLTADWQTYSETGVGGTFSFDVRGTANTIGESIRMHSWSMASSGCRFGSVQNIETSGAGYAKGLVEFRNMTVTKN